VLLDTRIVLWWLLADAQRLGAELVRMLRQRSDEVVVSTVVIWEASIKRKLGKLDPPLPDLLERLEAAGTSVMPIAARHADRAGGLPLHHRDPFDRLLVAQAQLERLPIVTVDPAIRLYDVETLG
jgi:PIN domain nuclease of toxin-antitoxin system